MHEGDDRGTLIGGEGEAGAVSCLKHAGAEGGCHEEAAGEVGRLGWRHGDEAACVEAAAVCCPEEVDAVFEAGELVHDKVVVLRFGGAALSGEVGEDEEGDRCHYNSKNEEEGYEFGDGVVGFGHGSVGVLGLF